MNPTVPTRRVAIVLDPACIWSYLAYTRFARAAARRRAEGDAVEVTFRPFQVDPQATTEGEPLTDVLRRLFGDKMEQQKAHATTLAEADGLAMNFDLTVHANTFQSHRLIALAAKQGQSERMVERLFRAYHSEGLNVADPDVLAKLAAEAGLTMHADGADELRAEMQEVLRSGVRGVPVFLFEDGPTLTGAPTEDTLREALETRN
jgi:predicted DsbA family dithiol-disulfide isomerase